jgi:hypothetical protein
MRTRLLALAALSCAAPAFAVDSTLVQAGYTGLGITPNAHLLGWGIAGYAYDNQLPGIPRDPTGHNHVLGLGFWPNLEVAARLATNDSNSNCFTQPGCGARDLSASGKVAIPLDAAKRWRGAFGAADVGGAATYYRTYYGVLTYDNGPLQASAGLAQRSGRGVSGSRSPLDGPFGSIAWQPLPLVRGHVEYTDGQAWAGVRVFAPEAWMPTGWQASLGLNQRLTSTNLTERSWLSATLSVPLYRAGTFASRAPNSASRAEVPMATAQVAAPSAATLAPATATAPAPMPANSGLIAPRPAPVLPVATAPAAAADDTLLKGLADTLQAKGLEDIGVGRASDGTIAVRANNGSYQWNAADAVGAALGAIARTLGDARVGYRLVVTQRQVPLVSVTGQADCLRDWIATGTNTCTAGQLSTPGTLALEPLHDGVQWVVDRQSPAWQRLRVGIAPALRTTVGTELGAVDYSVGAIVSAELPLWAGASVDAAVSAPMAQSFDFERGQVFGNRRIRSGAERLAFTQTLRLPVEQWFAAGGPAPRSGASAWMAQLTAGRIGGIYDGVLGGLRWEPGDGRHRVSAQAGTFSNNQFGKPDNPWPGVETAKPLLGSYRYSFLPTRTDLEATGGQFMNNDRGLQLSVRQWFDDVSVGVFYKRTKYTTENRAAQLVGVEFSIPLGPKRDWQVGQNLQFGGTPRFAHTIETSVRTGVAGNPLRPGRALAVPTPDLNDLFNSDRTGLAWWQDNVRRVREAAR